MRWSDPGDSATADEAAVVAMASAAGSMWEIAAHRAVRETGDPQMVANVLAIIFDEVGGANNYTPTRRNFFESIWRPARDADIVRLAERYGPAAIGRMYGMSPNRVSAILRRERCPARYGNTRQCLLSPDGQYRQHNGHAEAAQEGDREADRGQPAEREKIHRPTYA